ncbi:MAG: hypothetical protein IBX40_12015 [Methanosarcinales archaeon]|nr:hypothetical protein [Methanosarcinales archaeon]
MKEEKIVSVRDWVEPAHPTIIKLRDELVSIYKLIREKYQTEIDNTFDRVSRQIGFVVTTTIPVVFEVEREGKVNRISMGAEHLKGTLFERELSAALKPILSSDPIPALSTGNYKLNLIWFDALKLKLRTDWMEPAHFRPGGLVESIRPEIAAKLVGLKHCAWCEPAHWFDPGILIAMEDAVLIEAIDEVYPELKLVDRVASTREALRKVGPGVREPAHFRPIEGGLEPEKAKNVLSELASVLRKYGY